MGGHDVKPRRGAGLVELVEIGQVALVLSARLDVGRQGGGQDDCVRVCGTHLHGGLAQQPGILAGIHQPLSPVWPDIGLIPNLVELNGLAVALGEGPGEAPEVRLRSRWRQGIACVLGSSRPRRRTVQQGHQCKAAGGHIVDDGIPWLPVKDAGLRFDRLPGKPLAHPAEPRLRDAVEHRTALRRVGLLQRDRDAKLLRQTRSNRLER